MRIETILAIISYVIIICHNGGGKYGKCSLFSLTHPQTPNRHYKTEGYHIPLKRYNSLNRQFTILVRLRWGSKLNRGDNYVLNYKDHTYFKNVPAKGEQRMSATKVGDTELAECLEELTELEQNFCRVIAYNPGITQTQAIIQAGSKATKRNATKLASEMIKRPHVQRYIEFLKDAVAAQSGVTLEEIVGNARKAIDVAFMAGKAREVEPHNRLLAELGGFIRNTPTNATQINVGTEESSLKGEAIESDIRKLKNIVGISSIETS